ncbi:MAG: isoprenylcysteine carboxylmethyltransferase family protein [bacterium]|nr:isoprenylcysteine carboxylmethyltransferase family protein [bacterium]MDE0287675.1 isoprenylcysteine carboxylmethyltransferase family protein [bacterium]MDE0438188.1 isoprenylcysteine carboxylmethyltransferase family protein [bacterium]
MKVLARTALFTMIAPGTLSVLLPLLIESDRRETGRVGLGLALCLFALGAGVYLRSAWDFARLGKGTPAPIDAPTLLVTQGFYRYTRNPMYVAVLTVVSGWAVLFGSVVLAVYAVALLAMFSLFIRRYEEPRLVREFGDEYAEYMERVGRWLPRRRGRKRI